MLQQIICKKDLTIVAILEYLFRYFFIMFEVNGMYFIYIFL